MYAYSELRFLFLSFLSSFYQIFHLECNGMSDGYGRTHRKLYHANTTTIQTSDFFSESDLISDISGII